MRKDKIFDELLVLRCQEGDTKAFNLFIKRWHKKLLSFSYKFTKDLDVSKDITQECWISFHRNIGNLKTPSKVGSWLYRVVYNKSMDYLRKTKPVDVDHNEDILVSESNQLDERWPTVELLLNNLPIGHKTVLTLFYMEEHSIKEIAEILQIKEGTVKSRIFYARELLKRKYKEVNNETHK